MTLIILVITILVSVVAFQNDQLFSKLVFRPYQISRFNEWYRFLTCGFVHADLLHLFMNMFVLYQFGGYLERCYQLTFPGKGEYYFIPLYVGGILISMLPTYKKHRDNMYYSGMGASGAVSAVIFAIVLFDPWLKFNIYFILRVPAILMIPAYAWLSWYLDKRGGGNVNHNAHLWGGLFGIIYTIGLKPSIVIQFFHSLTGF